MALSKILKIIENKIKVPFLLQFVVVIVVVVVKYRQFYGLLERLNSKIFSLQMPPIKRQNTMPFLVYAFVCLFVFLPLHAFARWLMSIEELHFVRLETNSRN